jgi:hypothetical protein
MCVVVQVERSFGDDVTPKLTFEELECAKRDFFNVFLGYRVKVNKGNQFHAIIREELLCGCFVKSDLFHVCYLKEDISYLQRKLKRRSSLIDNNVSGRTAKSEDVSLTDSVESNKTEIVNVGHEFPSTVKRHMNWVGLDPFHTIGVV